MLYARLITLTLVCSVLLAGCIDRTKLKPSPENARRALILRGIEYSEAEFLQYAGVGDLWAVNTFLAAGINPNARNEREETALIVAAARGDLPVVRATLSGGADVNARDRNNRTALMRAILAGHEAVARHMLESAKVDVNLQEKFGQSALMMASWRMPQLVPLILDKGGEVNLQDTDGETALVRASLAGRVEVVRQLLKHGADPNIKNKLDGTPLMFAAANGHTVVVREFVRVGADLRAKDYKGRTARDWATKEGYADLAALLRKAEEGKNTVGGEQ